MKTITIPTTYTPKKEYKFDDFVVKRGKKTTVALAPQMSWATGIISFSINDSKIDGGSFNYRLFFDDILPIYKRYNFRNECKTVEVKDVTKYAEYYKYVNYDNIGEYVYPSVAGDILKGIKYSDVFMSLINDNEVIIATRNYSYIYDLHEHSCDSVIDLSYWQIVILVPTIESLFSLCRVLL